MKERKDEGQKGRRERIKKRKDEGEKGYRREG